MKANVTNLKKVLRICAKAHKCGFEDWSGENQLGVHSESVPVVSDVHMILDAFYGGHEAAETNYGYVTVWIDSSMRGCKREVDMDMLALALPHGTKLS